LRDPDDLLRVTMARLIVRLVGDRAVRREAIVAQRS
jgi:hypothetical protein